MATKAPQAGPASPATVAKALLKTLSPPIAIATTIWCLWLYSHIGSKVGLRRGKWPYAAQPLVVIRARFSTSAPPYPHHSAACPPLSLPPRSIGLPLPTLTHITPRPAPRFRFSNLCQPLTHTPQHTALYPTHAHHSGSFCTHCSCCSPSPCAHH